ncbi:MAG: hypothetical protein Q7S62_01415 [bacterium]|nr:hypothetical protein [bacterium]
MEFMGVSVTVEGLNESPQEGAGFASWARISAPKQGDPIKLVVTAGEEAFAIFESRPHTMGQDGFTLSVPVRWTDNGPMTRQKGVDNVDIILLDPNTRHFLDIQVGVVVRGGKFFLTAQKIWQGWIVGSSIEEIQFIPSAPEHAYPGADYASIWRGMGQVMTFVWSLIKDLGEGPGDVHPAIWRPIWTPTVLYFNMITGTGSIWVHESRYFVHFSVIEGPGPMKVLVPMSAVEVGFTEDPKTHRISVSSCKPVATE